MQLNWNSGGWFGAQLGGTAWILVAAILAGFQDIRTGLVLTAIFAIPNILGLAMWCWRKKLSCYASIQLLLFIMGIFSVISIYVLEKRSLWESIQRGGSVSAKSAYIIVVLVVLILMVNFYFRYGRKSNGNTA